jgi:hypothetical protein
MQTMQHRIGRVQRQVRRGFVAGGGRPVQFWDLMRWAYPSLPRSRGWQR